ncbi:transcriptional regulator NrdR [Desulfofalx alkaliphila]|uniref:transcriptional regulator NrdR n=1 Tax=Desulfofalx alkaliphila TaxID=105483 RepID=UPI0004E11B45|nr:transcriptional regulator NrdR [Desulfofalx alkaliphila]
MRCPFCGYLESRVLDSRSADDGHAIRRRRECGQCNKRFTTYERVDELPLVVVKKDGRRQVFDRSKLLSGLIKACEKRPIPVDTLEKLVKQIEKDLRNTMENEVSSIAIGEKVMDWLRQKDEVAYVRFASVYREFQDVYSFMQELERFLKKDKK